MSKTRIANKTMWALNDIIMDCTEARRAWQKAEERAEKTMDAVLMTSLGKLSDRLAMIERSARLALEGKYEQ